MDMNVNFLMAVKTAPTTTRGCFAKTAYAVWFSVGVGRLCNRSREFYSPRKSSATFTPTGRIAGQENITEVIMSDSKLTRSQTDKIIAGVCGGIANQLEVDPVFVRIGFLILLFASGIGFPIYMILWIVMPENGDGDEFIADPAALKERKFGAAGTIGIMLIMLGAYFLLGQWGLLGDGLVWVIAVVGVGLFVLLRKKS